ncbi:MAG: lysine--tRNA ligase [Candidatus Daviesbacteria bacterium]|nr:lysine--tRNA ligase [Candidatus Daviesbacteria bacterium]
MYWADKVAKEIIDSGKFKPYWVDDMWTPSGYLHIGSLKGPIVHDLITKALKHLRQEVTFTFVFNDFDPIDGLPEDLQEEFSKYMGLPVKSAPSPVKGYDSFADYFAKDAEKVFNAVGINAQYLSSWDMYHAGKFDEVIREALDNWEKIQDIYQKVSGSQKKESGWLPLQVICENCGKLGTTRVHNWDGKTVEYTCEEDLVKWAKGCGYSGRISPFGGNAKLPWKVDWVAHWKVIGVTIEGSGKDHSSAGGSRDIAKEECKEVFHIEEPYNLPYEFILIGGKKMSSSKGLGLKSHDLVDLLPLNVGRFLFCRTDYKQAVEFDPNGTMAIPDLFDEYDRCYKAYIEESDETLSRTFEMSQIGELPKKEPTFLTRFIDVVNYLQQPGTDLNKKFAEIKGGDLNETEERILNERQQYAKIWLQKYAPEKFNLQMRDTSLNKVSELDKDQKDYLLGVIDLLNKDSSAEDLQKELYDLSKEKKMDAKKAFAAIYLSLIGKEFGPKAGAFLSQYPKEEVIKRLKEAAK